MFRLSDGEEIMMLAFFVLTQYRSVKDGQRDGHSSSGYTSACIACYANALVKTVSDTAKVTIDHYSNSDMGFRLVPRSMTLMTFEGHFSLACHFYGDFHGFHGHFHFHFSNFL